jgi:hypothetical protein
MSVCDAVLLQFRASTCIFTVSCKYLMTYFIGLIMATFQLKPAIFLKEILLFSDCILSEFYYFLFLNGWLTALPRKHNLLCLQGRNRM